MLPVVQVFADLIQDPLADLHDEIRFLGERNELGGQYHAPVRQFPANQRLRTDDGATPDVDFRLVMNQQLVEFIRPAQLTLEHQAFDRGGIHLRVVKLETVSRAALRVIQRGVGAADQVDDVVGVPREARNTDADTHVDLVSLHDDWFGEVFAQLPGEGLQEGVEFGRRPVPFDRDGEFVAGEPSADGMVGQCLGQSARE